MHYLTYFLATLSLIGAWLLGIRLTSGEFGAAMVSIVTMGFLIALLMYYD